MNRHTRAAMAVLSGLTMLTTHASASRADAHVATAQTRSSTAATVTTREGTPTELEMVKVVVRMPDGRVVTRMEPKYASRVHIPDDRGIAEIQTGTGSVSNTARTPAGGGGGGAAGASGFRSGGSGGGGGGGAISGGAGARGQFTGLSKGGGTGGGGSAETDTSTPDPDDEADAGRPGVPVWVYTWRRNIPEPFENMIETVLLDPRAGSPTQLANRIAARVRANPQRKIGLRYWKELRSADRDPFDISDPAELWQRHGYRDGMEPYWQAVADHLKQLGITPDYLVQDLELGVRYWEIPVEERTRFFTELFAGRDRVGDNLPAEVFSVPVETFLDRNNPAGHAAREAYEQAAVDMRTSIISETMHQPFVRAYGQVIPHSNYKDILPSFEVTRFNAKPWYPTTIHGISAPPTYLVDYGPNVKYGRMEKIARWNHLIAMINTLRSAAANGPVHPWVSAPGHGRHGSGTWGRLADFDEECWLWDNFMNHVLAMGIDTIIMWNADSSWGNSTAMQGDRYMDQWFGGKTAHHELLVLPEIPFDADQIETNGYVTTYQDFVRNVKSGL